MVAAKGTIESLRFGSALTGFTELRLEVKFNAEGHSEIRKEPICEAEDRIVEPKHQRKIQISIRGCRRKTSYNKY